MSALSATLLAGYSGESGAITTDDFGSNTLTNNNGVTSVAGKVGNAWNFVAANSQSLSIADNATFSLGGTSAYWAYWVRLASKSGSMTLLAKDDGSIREYFQMYYVLVDRFIFDTWTGTGGAGNVRLTLDSFGSPSISTWYFLQFWIDSVGGTMNGCVNNGTVDSISAPSAGWNGSQPLYFGSLSNTPGWFHDGLMDQFIFSKTIPSSGDRAWLYNGGAGRSAADIVNKGSLGALIVPAILGAVNV